MNDLPHEEESELEEASTIEIDENMVARFADMIEDEDRDGLVISIEDLHPADIADLLEQVPNDLLGDAVRMLSDVLPADTIAEMDEDKRYIALEAMTDNVVATVLETLDSDDAALVINDLEEDRQERVLEQINAGDRAAIENSLTFDEETAGRLMQRDFVAAPDFWTVGQAIDHMRSTDDLPEAFFEVYLVDAVFHLKGAVPLSALIRVPRETPLNEIKIDISSAVKPHMDQEEVAYIFQQYNLASAPVVDEDGRLTGMITVDDMVDVIQEENKEDLLALSGVNEGSAHQAVWDAFRARAPWLGVNLFTSFLASGVISLFEATLDRIIALAILMPVVVALGGNAGSQALAVTVRAIAERDMMGKTAVRAVRREAFTAVINGVLFGAGVAAIAMLWFQDPALSAVLGVAMFLTFVWAGLCGVLVPLGLKKVGADPAVASSVFVLTSVDIIGFCAFLGLASSFLL